MDLKSKIKRVIEKPSRLPIGILLRYSYLFGNKTALVYALYWKAFGKRPNLKNPKTFNEKLQWLKLHDHNPLYHTMVDKYEVKNYVSNLIGKDYVIPTLGVWENFEDIDFDSLPAQFVLKTTNGGGNTGVVICKDKDNFDKLSASAKLKKSMDFNIYESLAEWSYMGVKPRIIAEQYMEDEKNGNLVDYKLWCFNGVPKVLFYASDRINDKNLPPKFDYYDMNLNRLEVRSVGHENSSKPIIYFDTFDEMKEIARTLSKNIPFVRVDLYNINGKVYFGELTFYHDAGLVGFEPQEWDLIFGNLLDISHI